MSERQTSFIEYYLSELSRLEAGMGEFAHAYPGSAAGLGIGLDATSDPHVRLLIEAVSYIAAQLRLEIDRVPGEYAYMLLQAICPAILRPLPSTAIVQFFPTAASTSVEGTRLPAALQLSQQESEGSVRFEVAETSQVWPFTLEAFWDVAQDRNHSVDDQSALVLRLSAHRDINPQTPASLTLFVGGPLEAALSGVQALLLDTRLQQIRATDRSWSRNVDGHLPVGVDLPSSGFFVESDLDEQVQQWLTYPRSACFVRIEGIARAAPTCSFELVFSVSKRSRDAIDAVREHIALNCAIVRNEFSRQTLSLALDERRSEYRLAEAGQNQHPWDVCSITRVRTVTDGQIEVLQQWRPEHVHAQDHDGWAWTSSRARHVSGDNGTPTALLRFVRGPRAKPRTTALVDVRCYQRDLAQTLAAQTVLVTHSWDGRWRARLLFAPSASREPVFPTDAGLPDLVGAALWHAHTDDPLSRRDEIVRFLKMYERHGNPFALRLIDSLRAMERELVALPVQVADGHIALGMGARYDLWFDERAAEGGQYLIARMIGKIFRQLNDLDKLVELRFLRGARQECLRVI
ncbi:type VI secretion system baseplate subunit TssF [Caballeronia zhejiangensis]|uniref:type VI secretion system baseplate subunit TssF n=1 Tax=Caballeronia zhejiangensis TaxID=871203 RepID=UPI00158A5449|nr:type VI secretion system baseplate subunit TssF [Caballeronia zhejiangensis]